MQTTPTRPTPEPKRPLLIVCDDDDDMRALVASYLERRGFEVVQASDGAALELVVRAALDAGAATSTPTPLVLSDVRMPFMSGLDALARLRASRARVGFVLWSAFADFEVRAAASSLGVAAFLDKPFSLEELYEVVCTVLAPGAP